MYSNLRHTIKRYSGNRKAVAGLVVLCTLVLLPALFYPWNDEYYPRSLKTAWNLGHVGLFAILTVIFLRSRYIAARSILYQLLAAVGLAVVLGGLIELVQYYLGRDASFYDLYLDVLGAVLAITWISRFRERDAVIARGLRILTIILLLVGTYPAGMMLVDEHTARQQFPVLADFRSSLQTSRFGGNAAKQWIDNRLQVLLSTEHYSGFSLKYFPRDWRGYDSLFLVLDNPVSKPVSLTCRIHDIAHNHQYADRYNKQFILVEGRQRIQIDLAEVRAAPVSREMNIDRIAAVGCFTTSLQYPAILYVDSIYLE